MTLANRRMFIVHAAAAGAALACVQARAQPAAPKLDEADPQAVALGYKHYTAKADQKKYPKHELSQVCSNCQLFQGRPADPWAPCALFAGKQVAGKGWCSAWVKKAG